MKPSHKPPIILSIEEIERLLAAPDEAAPQGMRDKAMLELLYATGIRVTELISLNVEDVNTSLRFARCSGASGKERVVPIGVIAADCVARYTSGMRDKLLRASREEPALFLNSLGGRLTRQGFWKIIKNTRVKLRLSRTSHRILCATPSLRICWKAGRTCALCSRCWAIPIVRPLRYTAELPARI